MTCSSLSKSHQQKVPTPLCISLEKRPERDKHHSKISRPYDVSNCFVTCFLIDDCMAIFVRIVYVFVTPYDVSLPASIRVPPVTFLLSLCSLSLWCWWMVFRKSVRSVRLFWDPWKIGQRLLLPCCLDQRFRVVGLSSLLGLACDSTVLYRMWISCWKDW